MNKSDAHHQIANELGIAIGMVQLAKRKLEDGEASAAPAIPHYLERADAALGRLKLLLEELKQQDASASRP
jgi:site-specific recombinase